MKNFKKILALVVAFTMLMSVSAFAATLTTGTNGKTIDLSFRFTSDAKGNTEITEVTSGSTFYMWVDFSGNPTDYRVDGTTIVSDEGVTDFELVIGYDADKMSITGKSDQAASIGDGWNGSYNEGVLALTFAATGSFYDEDEEVVYGEGSLVRIKANASAGMTEADLKAITVLSSASNTDGSKTINSYMADTNGGKFTITIPDVEEEKEPVPVNKYLPAVSPVTSLETEDGTYTNVAIYKATFENLGNLNATKIGYSLKKANKDTDNGREFATEFSGTGKVEFVLPIYGITEAEAAELTFTPWYTVMEVPAEN